MSKKSKVVKPDSHNIFKQCKIYRDIIENEVKNKSMNPSFWAKKLDVSIVSDNDCDTGMDFEYNNSNMWKNISRCIKICSNKNKLRIVFQMDNGKSVSLGVLRDLKTAWHHVLLRRFIELNDCRDTSFDKT